MLWLKSKLKVGYVRIKKDNMFEYVIIGKYVVVIIIKELLLYLRIKKELG